MPAAGARPKATKIYLIDCAWSRNLPKTQHTSYTHTLTLLKYFSSASHDSHFHTIWLVILYFYYFYIFFYYFTFFQSIEFMFHSKPFSSWTGPQVPTIDQLKKESFSTCEKMVSQMSLYLSLTAISYKRLVTGSGKKKSTLWHNRQFAYALWMSKHWWGSLYVFMEESFSHRRSACAV